MRKQSFVGSTQDEKEATLMFVRSLCARIEQALEQVEQVCAEELAPQPPPSSLGQCEGIGLYLYIKENQVSMQTKYPAFTQNQILSILLAQWQKMDDPQKLVYCSKIDLKQLNSSKKLKKLDKMATKLSQRIQATHEVVNLQQDLESQSEIAINPIKQTKLLRQSVIEECQFDRFSDESNPRKKKSMQVVDRLPHIKQVQKQVQNQLLVSQVPFTQNIATQTHKEQRHEDEKVHELEQIVQPINGCEQRKQSHKVCNTTQQQNLNEMKDQNGRQNVQANDAAQQDQPLSQQPALKQSQFAEMKQVKGNSQGSVLLQQSDNEQVQGQSIPPQQTKIASINDEPMHASPIDIDEMPQKHDNLVANDANNIAQPPSASQTKLIQHIDDFFVEDKQQFNYQQTPQFPNIEELQNGHQPAKPQESNPETAQP